MHRGNLRYGINGKGEFFAYRRKGDSGITTLTSATTLETFIQAIAASKDPSFFAYLPKLEAQRERVAQAERRRIEIIAASADSYHFE